MIKLKNNLYATYSGVFLIFILISLILSQIQHETLFSFGLFTDGFKQHLVFLYDYVSHIKEAITNGSLSIYRYNLGLGSDMLLAYAYYSLFDPLTLIAYLIPIEHIELSYYLIAIIRLYLAGFFFILFAKKMQITHQNALLAAAIFYVFNASVLYSAFRHPMFINGAMLLSLALLGAEKVLRNESPALIMIISALALATQFYFFLFTCVGFELYVLLRQGIGISRANYKKKVRPFIKVNIAYLIGSLMAGFILLTQFYATLNSGRIAPKGMTIFDAFDYGTFLSTFFIPMVGQHYTASIGNFVVFFLMLLFMFQTKKRWETFFFIIIASMMMIPIFGYVFNAFAYVNNRWTYLMILPAAMMLAYIIEHAKDISRDAIRKSIKTFIYTIIVMFAFGFVYIVEGFNQMGITIAVILLLIPILIWIGARIQRSPMRNKIHQILTSQAMIRATIISSFVILLFFAALYHFTMTASEGFDAYPTENSFLFNTEDTDFYRVDQKIYALNTTYLANDNLVGGYNATYYYNTMASGYISNVIQFFDVTNLNSTAGYNGFQNRSYLNALHQVKYILIRESEKTAIPYGYTLYQTIQLPKFVPDQYNFVEMGYIEYENNEVVHEDVYIYQNQHFLSFGQMYHQYVLEDDLIALNGIERERILLDAIILPAALNSMSHSEEDYTIPKQAISSIITEGLTIVNEDGEPYNPSFNQGKHTISVTEDIGTISFSVDDVVDSELYVEITHLYEASSGSAFEVQYDTQTSSHTEKTYRYGTNFYFENPDHLIHLGYYDQEDVQVTITFTKGEYTFNDLNCILAPMDKYDDQITTLNQETLENIEWNTNGFRATINAIQSGMLFVSLPYHSGFRAYVNGIETPIERVNIGYMGIYLEDGTHTISFVYQTPGLKVGLVISFVAILIAITWVGIDLRSKRRKNV